jgi:hypothetical protein
MNDSNLIQDFLDGSLSSIQEDEFFMKLNSNEELRGELKQFINIDKAFDKKLSTFAPSAKSTLAVFSALGINTPLPAPIQTTAAEGLSKAPGFITKYRQGIYSGLLASALTAALFLGFFGNDIFKKDNTYIVTDNLQNKKQINQSPSQSTENKLPISDSRSVDIKHKIITKIVYIPVGEKSNDIYNDFADIDQNNQLDKIVEQKKENMAQVTESSVLNIPNKNFNDFRNVNKYNFTELLKFNLNSNIKGFSINDPLGLIVEIKGGQYWQIQNVPMEQSTIPIFYNMGLSLGYKLSDNLTIDVDVRNEHYYQEYEGTDEIGDKYMYRQYPNYLAVTAGCKWNFLNFEPFSTYSQLMIGGTLTGYVGRSVLGFEYSPQPAFKFILNVEGSVLGFVYQGVTYLSPKLGMNYGVAFNF